MNTLFKSMIKGGLFGLAVVLGTTACTDDHFDIDGASGTGGSTLWANIQSNGSTDSLAMILSRTMVMKSETDKSGKINYGEMLDQAQTFTVWAPKDGTYNARYYLNLLDQRDALIGDSATNASAWALNYTVANQFVTNHVARFSFESNKQRQKVRMLNSKVCYYEAGANQFNNVQLESDATLNSITSSNGTLHVLAGVSPFAYNLYDYIGYHDEFTSLWTILSDPNVEKETFNESGSTEGAMNENGEMVYVDSVFRSTNAYLDECGASIKDEDSLYVALLPTNEAWEGAYNTVSTLFNYGKRYNYDWNSSSGDFNKKGNDGLILDADSLKAYNTNKTLIESAFFTTANLPITDQTDSATINNYVLNADSLISTNGTIYYNSNIGGENPIFNGQKPIKASNGYLYAVTDYKVNPSYAWISKHEESLAASFNVANVKGSTSTSGESVTLTEDTRNDSVYGEVDDDMYRRFEVNGRSTMQIDIRLDNIYSGKYKISAVMLPNRTCLSNIRYDSKTGEEIQEAAQFTCQIRDDADSQIGSTSATITVDNDSIKTYVLFESVEFPKCYVDLPSGFTSFPRLRFTMSPLNQSRGKSNSLNISKIIIEPVRE